MAASAFIAVVAVSVVLSTLFFLRRRNSTLEVTGGEEALLDLGLRV